MDDQEQLVRELHGLMNQRCEIDAKIGKIERQLDDYRSREFIRVNHITKDDVFVPEAWCGTFWQLSKHILNNRGIKCCRFCEWNGRLHYTSDVAVGKFAPTHAKIGDVK